MSVRTPYCNMLSKKPQSSALHLGSLVASMRSHSLSTESFGARQCASCLKAIAKIERCLVSTLSSNSGTNGVGGSNGCRSSQIGLFTLSEGNNAIKYLVTVTPARLYTLPTTNLPCCISSSNSNPLFYVTKRPGCQLSTIFSTTCPLFVTMCANHVLILYRLHSRRDGAKLNPRTIRSVASFLSQNWSREKTLWVISALSIVYSAFVASQCYSFEFNLTSFYVLDDKDTESRSLCWPWADTISGSTLETLHNTIELSLPKFTIGDSTTFTCLSFRTIAKPPLGAFKPATTAHTGGSKRRGATALSNTLQVRQRVSSGVSRTKPGGPLGATGVSLRQLSTIVDPDAPLAKYRPVNYSLDASNIPLCSILHDYQEELQMEQGGRILGSLLLMSHRAIVAVVAVVTNSISALQRPPRVAIGGQQPRWKCAASKTCSLYMIPTTVISTDTTNTAFTTTVPEASIGRSDGGANTGQDVLELIHYRVCGELQETVHQIAIASALAADNKDAPGDCHQASQCAKKVARSLEELVAVLSKGYIFPISSQ